VLCLLLLAVRFAGARWLVAQGVGAVRLPPPDEAAALLCDLEGARKWCGCGKRKLSRGGAAGAKGKGSGGAGGDGKKRHHHKHHDKQNTGGGSEMVGSAASGADRQLAQRVDV
jgi:hypothetical protein